MLPQRGVNTSTPPQLTTVKLCQILSSFVRFIAKCCKPSDSAHVNTCITMSHPCPPMNHKRRLLILESGLTALNREPVGIGVAVATPEVSRIAA